MVASGLVIGPACLGNMAGLSVAGGEFGRDYGLGDAEKCSVAKFQANFFPEKFDNRTLTKVREISGKSW